MQSYLVSVIALAVLVALGIAILRLVGGWGRRDEGDGGGVGRGDWENALAGYKNLRDQGVLSEEEYRKIRTLVEPHMQRAEMVGESAPPLPSTGAAAGAGPAKPPLPADPDSPST